VSRDPLKSYAGWNDTNWIKAELEKALAKAAAVAPKTLRRALRRVIVDGYYGPIADREYEAMAGVRMSMARARSIIRRAQDAPVSTIYVDDPDSGYSCEGASDCKHPEHAELGDDGPMFHTEPVEIDGRKLTEWYSRELAPIYGSVWI
jgi:hypothetical protein